MAYQKKSDSEITETARKLRGLRLQHGMTQKEVAKAIGVSIRTYNYYENSEKLPIRNDYMAKICELFKISPEYFVTSSSEDVDPSLFSLDPYEKAGSTKATIRTVMVQINALFSGGELSRGEKDEIMGAISDLYFKAMKRHSESENDPSVINKYDEDDEYDDESEYDDEE